EFVESSRRLERAGGRGRSRVKEATSEGAEMKPMVSECSAGGGVARRESSSGVGAGPQWAEGGELQGRAQLDQNQLLGLVKETFQMAVAMKMTHVGYWIRNLIGCRISDVSLAASSVRWNIFILLESVSRKSREKEGEWAELPAAETAEFRWSAITPERVFLLLFIPSE
ncbi:hypothetical protein XENOCAPTIV_026218, partial [Xenoophorus captivus]